ncbi:hypothetical protein J3Q64DRAFT_1733728 [Phycomyces blakesleeanus]|uniref:CLIP1 zinc knuckle domain-containing protein n=2 Tax=Phycomyces blakesleeanus TaxID=4837 RepID=A0A167L547_PHYB8|nr:hypothetical protein PHYBLDRAFT_182797 [Phycomyces blakesleeanus NRRL 1555(-)]OAD69609.1 hypothetical protein PHYBLDRAFT_182797 [Phycomyces blakesleeanus NRRL 1555(-)]|eukprot:XP_018287649.1 hypothetical protein PHYBLDRAFT_182797 [Phycomyces blakesleeanus NRRL 1555(-)]
MENPYACHSASLGGVRYTPPSPSGLFDVSFKDIPKPKPTKTSSFKKPAPSSLPSSPSSSTPKPRPSQNSTQNPKPTNTKSARNPHLTRLSHPSSSVTRSQTLRSPTDPGLLRLNNKTDLTRKKKSSQKEPPVAWTTASTLEPSEQSPWTRADVIHAIKQHHLQQIKALDSLITIPHTKTIDDNKKPCLVLPTLEQAFGELQVTSAHLIEQQLMVITQTLQRDSQTIAAANIELKNQVSQLQHSHVALKDQAAHLQAALTQAQLETQRTRSSLRAAIDAQTKAEDDHERLRMAHAKSEWDLLDTRKTLSQYKACFGALVPQKGNTGGPLQYQQQSKGDQKSLLDEARQSNAELKARIVTLEEKQIELEQECMALMDDMFDLERDHGVLPASQSSRTVDDSRQQNQLERYRLQAETHHKRYLALEESTKAKIDALQTELAETEALLESRILVEAELETSLAIERRRADQLAEKKHLSEWLPLSPVSLSFSQSTESLHESAVLYCEICEVEGHDVLSCTAHRSDYDILEQLYCENCDLYNIHSTHDCPNHDEMF